MKPDDDPDNKANLQGNGSVESTLRRKIADLERELREEKERFDLLQFEACQEVEQHARDCVSLKDNVARLEQDCAILRERGHEDQERIKNLLAVIERKDRVFKEKFVELKSEIRDLETAKRRAEDEVVGMRMEKGAVYGELEARALKLADENLRLLEDARENVSGVKVDEEMPKRNVELALTPEPTWKRVLEGVDSESEEDKIPFAQLMCMKRYDGPGERSAQSASFGNQSSSCNGIGHSMKLPRKKLFLQKSCGEGIDGVEESSDRMVGDQIPITAANHELKNLAISQTSKGLLDAAEREYKLLKYNKRSRSKKKFKSVDINYSPMVARAEIQLFPERNSKNKKGRVYTRRTAYSDKQVRALERAEEVRSNLKSGHPSFARSMIRSYVTGCFWLCLTTKFCKENLPDCRMMMVLEDEKGLEHYTIYIASRVGLSGGWKGFTVDHKLEIGDALVFELIAPERFKVYIIKADQEPGETLDGKIAEKDTGGTIKRAKCGQIRNTRSRFVFPKKPSKMEVGLLSNTGRTEDINITDKSLLLV